MEVFSFKIDPEDVKKGRVEVEPNVRASNPCPCGCAPKTFVLISDGKIGLTARFETEEELTRFKDAVRVLQMPHADDCRLCEHMVDKRPLCSRKFIGGCEFDLRPESCGRFQLASEFEGHDPRVKH